jgi:hypothetical protein
VCDEIGPLERVDRDVDRRDAVALLAGLADALTDVEHRRLVTLALADHDPARELDLVHGRAHRRGRGGVRLVARAAAHEPGGLDGRSLGHAHHLERQQLFHLPTSPQCLKCLRPVKTIAM